MKICIVQTKSKKGQIQANIKNHLRIVEIATEFNSDIIIFPELSITSYEPSLAEKLAIEKEDEILNEIQRSSDKNQITIGVGMPTKAINGINISMLIFQPNKKDRTIYSKRILHDDEKPYFVSGIEQPLLQKEGKKIALGICYETLQRSHFINAKEKGASIYIASVSKPNRGVDKAYLHFPSIAKEFNTPILMANSIGFCDNFLSNGKSSIWNKNGDLIGQLNEENEGILIYNTKKQTVEALQLQISKAQLFDLEKIFKIYINAKRYLENDNIFQWTANYPTIRIIKTDIEKELLYVLKSKNEIIGAINISEIQEPEYTSVNWVFNSDKILVVHRLVVNPKYQGKGYAKDLMNFAENFAMKNNYTSIRLDAYSKNEKVIEFYKKRDYKIRGEVYFPERKFPFYCLEKEIINSF